jgi:hypothetical protein
MPAPFEPLRRLVTATFTALFFAAGMPLAWGGSPALLDAGDPALRSDLAWLADRGVLQLSLSTWPTTVSLVEDAIAQCDCTGLYPEDLEALAHVKRALQRARARSVTLGLRLNSARHPAIDPLVPARGRGQLSVAAQEAGDDWAVRLQGNGVAQPLAASDSRATLDGSYAAFNGPGLVVALAAVDRWWGPGQHASPVLSNAAPAVPALLLRRATETPFESPWLSWVGPWSYELSIGRLQHYQPSGAYTLTMRLSARPLPGLELGASRYIYWGGAGRPTSFGSLWRALTGDSNVDDPATETDPSNELAGLDMRWSPPILMGPSLSIYGQVVGEDEANASPSHLIGTFGVEAKQPVAGHRLEFTLEASDTELGRLWGMADGRHAAPAYRHSAYPQGHYHQGLPIGAFFGGGGRSLGAGLSWVPPDNGHGLRFHVRGWRAWLGERGFETVNTAYGHTGRLDGALLRVQGDTAASGLRWHAAVSVQRYAAGPRRSVGLQAGIELPIDAPD